jgi:hypothetical protein
MVVHTGACVASLLGQGGSRKYRLTWKWLRYLKNDRDRRNLITYVITCGAAAGVACCLPCSSWWGPLCTGRSSFMVSLSLSVWCYISSC